MFCKEVLVRSAIECGLLEDDNPNFIPETLGVLKSIADAATETIFENPAANGLSIQIIQKSFNYAFIKGIESFFLWQDSADGNVPFSFSENDLFNGYEGALISQNSADFINGAMGLCNDMFRAFQEWLKANQDLFQGEFINLYEELNEALNWSSRIGLSFTVSKLHGNK